jgi:Putative prokaryotic signal transducing protein
VREVLSTTDQSLAESFRLALEGEGIHAVKNDPVGASLPFLPTTLFVEDADYDRARALLETLRPASPQLRIEAESSPWVRRVALVVVALAALLLLFKAAFG